MKIIITGSLGNVAAPLVEILVSEGHQITVISSNADKTELIENAGAEPAIGSVEDQAFLNTTFKDADAVFLMTPPMISASEIVKKTVEVGEKYAEAIRNSGVKKLVMLSSVGADLAADNGPIAALHSIENIYRKLPGVSATLLRAGNFFTNLYNDIPLMKKEGIIGSNYAADQYIPWSHPRDIAKAAAGTLTGESRTGSTVKYTVSDYRSGSEIAAVLGSSIGKPELPWIQFSDDDSFHGMTGAGLPDEMAELYVEMGRGLQAGAIQRDFIQNGKPINGETKLEDFAEEFRQQYHNFS